MKKVYCIAVDDGNYDEHIINDYGVFSTYEKAREIQIKDSIQESIELNDLFDSIYEIFDILVDDVSLVKKWKQVMDDDSYDEEKYTSLESEFYCWLEKNLYHFCDTYNKKTEAEVFACNIYKVIELEFH